MALSTTTYVATTILLLLLTPLTLFLLRTLPPNAPLFLREWPISGSPRFFTQRGVFLQENRSKSPTGQFSFMYGPNPIVALSGVHGRATHYAARGMDLSQGFATLLAAGPDLRSIYKEDMTVLFSANFKKFTSRERLVGALETLRGDCHAAIGDLPAVFDHFPGMFKLVYQLTHRTLGCNDIANDPKRLSETLACYQNLDQSTGLEVMFPTLPIPARLKKMYSGARLHWALSAVVRERRKTGRRENDAMQIMIDDGHEEFPISGFIIGALFAGVINSGASAGWILTHLANTPEWYQRVREEVDAALEKHRHSPTETAVDIFPRLDMNDWETDFPMIDLCLKESIRIEMPGASMRKNISGKDIPIGSTKEVVPNNGFSVYLLDDTHLDADIYPDPMRWDPGRYLPDRAEDKKLEHAYVGWGTGLHPCLGMRFAKLEIALTTAMFMGYYDFSLCDKDGKPWTGEFPRTDRDSHKAHAPKVPIFLKTERRF